MNIIDLLIVITISALSSRMLKVITKEAPNATRTDKNKILEDAVNLLNVRIYLNCHICKDIKTSW